MKTKTLTGICVALLAMTIGASRAWAAKKEEAPPTPLTDAGQRLLKRYAGMLAEVKAQITRSVPLAKEKEQADSLRKAELAREAAIKAEEARRKAKIPYAHMLANSPDGLGTDAQDSELPDYLQPKTKKPAAQPVKPPSAVDKADRKVRTIFLFLKALDDQAKVELRHQKSPAFVAAMSNTTNAAKPVLTELAAFLSSDKLDAQFAEYLVLSEATPRGLAEFSQQGKKQEMLIEKLLADHNLMMQMVVADGAKDGKYGRAMEIYTAIQEASAKARDGALQRLALGISLEHAVPIAQQNPKAQTDAPAIVDPVQRYLHYEKAFLAGELDPGFKDLTVWDYRMVVYGNEPDWTLAWGREMLHNYRPDHIATGDYRWRYVAAVRTEIRYGSQDNKYDKPELQFFQNILMNGGVCGRRAFFGRFMLRAFGVPTTARPQTGHAALVHWTPDGWVPCLGGGWGAGWVMGRHKDLDFLAITQARAAGEKYMQVERARWIGDVLGEPRTFGFFSSGDPAFWNAVALCRQREIIEEAKAEALAAVGEDIGEADESKVKEAVEAATVPEADRKITVGRDGVITIPAAACSQPTNSTRKIRFMKSDLGGMQLHYNRLGPAETFEYTFDAPAAGKYALTARVVTPSWKQHLLVAVNGGKTPTDIALPFTVGMWEKTKPVTVSLVKGRNVLCFSRGSDRWVKGLTIRDFTLTPVK